MNTHYIFFGYSLEWFIPISSTVPFRLLPFCLLSHFVYTQDDALLIKKSILCKFKVTIGHFTILIRSLEFSWPAQENITNHEGKSYVSEPRIY